MDERSDTDVSIEVYKVVFETWRSQVESYWQRSNYFAAFETAALTGCWYLVEHKHPKVGIFVSILGVALTITWLLSNSAVHSYVEYWWKAIITVETKLFFGYKGLAFASEHPGSRRPLRYSDLVQIVPWLFMTAWIALFLLAYCSICSRVGSGTPT